MENEVVAGFDGSKDDVMNVVEQQNAYTCFFTQNTISYLTYNIIS